MCFTKEVSLFAFIINVISAFLLYKLSDNKELKIAALFFAFVGLMQLYDYIFWINQEKNSINKITTKFAMVTNHLQPIVLGLLIYYFKGVVDTCSKNLLISYIIAISVYTLYNFNKVNYTFIEKCDSTHIKDEKKCHKKSLSWEWNQKEYNNLVYFIFLLTICVLSMNNFSQPLNYILTSFALITFFVSFFNYKNNSIGRFWCYFASFIPAILLGMKYFKLV